MRAALVAVGMTRLLLKTLKGPGELRVQKNDQLPFKKSVYLNLKALVVITQIPKYKAHLFDIL